MANETNKVLGKDWVGYAFIGGIWQPYICARSGNINIETETIETTVTRSGNWKTFEGTVNSFGASLDGIVALNVSGSLTLPDLQAIQISKTKMLWRFIQTSIAGDVYIKEAYFLITSSTDTGSFDGIATFSISLKGTGAITQIFTPPSPTDGSVTRYPAQGSTAPVTPGVVTVTVPGLGGKNMLTIAKNGQVNNNIILTGTPVNQEVLYETSGSDGIFTWPFPFADGETWYCEYQDL